MKWKVLELSYLRRELEAMACSFAERSLAQVRFLVALPAFGTKLCEMRNLPGMAKEGQSLKHRNVPTKTVPRVK